MRHPEKWRETADPFVLPYRHFSLLEVLGYPHASNDVFQAKGLYHGQEVEAYIKVARRRDADLENELHTIRSIHCDLAPEIIDHDEEQKQFCVSLARPGMRLSMILGDNADLASLDYLYEYGQTLAKLHGQQGTFPDVKDRKFFHIPDRQYLAELGLEYVHDYLTANQPKEITKCFCHGDFHYANILWQDKHMSAILDFELSGWGNREFDIAWALIRRPGQRFMKTPREVSLFLDGYLSVGSCRVDDVEYYMILIYSYFYAVGDDDPEYQEYVRNVFSGHCIP